MYNYYDYSNQYNCNNCNNCNNFSTYTTGVRAKDKRTQCLLVDIMNKTSCFQEVCIKLIDHSTAEPILLAHENVPVEKCKDQLLKLQLQDVYYGNAMNITLYEIQICLANTQCTYISIFELDEAEQVIPTQTMVTSDLLPVSC